jgi:hypothetical protein
MMGMGLGLKQAVVVVACRVDVMGVMSRSIKITSIRMGSEEGRGGGLCGCYAML